MKPHSSGEPLLHYKPYRNVDIIIISNHTILLSCGLLLHIVVCLPIISSETQEVFVGFDWTELSLHASSYCVYVWCDYSMIDE